MMDVVVDMGAAPGGATTMTARDLSTPGWRLDPLRPEVATAVIGGCAVTAGEIASVTVRNAAVRRATLAWIAPDDRAYAAAEMTATLTAWLGVLPSPVDPRPLRPLPLGTHDEPKSGRPLLVGSSVDTPVLEVRSCLYRRGCSPLVFDENSLRSLDVAAVLRGDRIGSVPLTGVGAAYLRPDPCLGPAQYALLSWAQRAPGTVVNRPSAMALNATKPLQLAVISHSGFDVPATVVTTSAEVAHAFVGDYGRVVYKSGSGVRSVVTELTKVDTERLRDVSVCPTLFQAFVPGVDVRVHVVGTQTFACELRADSLDYRYARRLTMCPVELPTDLHERVVTMVRAMGLHVSGVDLRHRTDGGWTCLEVNPSPAFTWYTWHTGQPVAEAIADLLLAGTRHQASTACPATGGSQRVPNGLMAHGAHNEAVSG
jgi:glutathione synthase/RimK-type ligase-like ATP-grasp enzyme